MFLRVKAKETHTVDTQTVFKVCKHRAESEAKNQQISREKEGGQRVEWLIVMLSSLKRAGQVL